MSCTRINKPSQFKLDTMLVFKDKDNEVKISEHRWCKECSDSYHTICDIIASRFKIDFDNNFLPLIELRKQSQKARQFLTCVNFFSSEKIKYDDKIISLILGFERYKKGLMSIADCIRQRLFHHKNCTLSVYDDKPRMFGNKTHTDFLVAISIEFLLLYQPFEDFLPELKIKIDNAMKYYYIDFKVKDFIINDIKVKYRDIFSAIDTLITYSFNNRRELISYIKQRNEDIGIKNLKEDKNEVCKYVKDCIMNSEEALDCVLDKDIYITTSEETAIYDFLIDYFKTVYKFQEDPLLKKKRIHLTPKRTPEERAKSRGHSKWLNKQKERIKKVKEIKQKQDLKKKYH